MSQLLLINKLTQAQYMETLVWGYCSWEEEKKEEEEEEEE
jgi:hypothetical protein